MDGRVLHFGDLFQSNDPSGASVSMVPTGLATLKSYMVLFALQSYSFLGIVKSRAMGYSCGCYYVGI